ncbi:MAG: hypothetical protein HOC74_34905, partial [Gemmatimonadetes bacterium]|nr:hypothetical protein [Gemmatimonadota bacterium]
MKEMIYPRPQWLKRTEAVCRFERVAEVGWAGEGCEGLAEMVAEELRIRGVGEVRVGSASAGIVVGLLKDRDVVARLDERGLVVPEEG